MHTLIAYFSRKGNNYVSGQIINLPVGNTEIAAGILRTLAGGDLFKIESVQPYPQDYTACTVTAKEELHADARPELTAQVANFDTYDVIYLGYPNWWGTMPMPVFTFLEQYNFDGKIICPFCTNEGSGMGSSARDIKKLCPGATVKGGLSIQGGSAARSVTDIAAWIKDIAG